MSGWWNWLEGEYPVVQPARFCEKCGKQLEFVGPTQMRRHDSESGKRVIEWRLRCPNWGTWRSVFALWPPHDDRHLMPQRTRIPPSIDRWSGQKPVYASVDPGLRSP